MKVNTSFNKPAPVDPVVIEQVYAEKPGGGRVENPSYEIKQGTAVYQDGTMFKPIKAFRLVKAVASGDTTIEIAKGSGIEVGDVIAHGKKGVECTSVDSSNENKDVVSVTLGENIANDTVLYQAESASAADAAPAGTPIYVVGNNVPAGKGDFPVRLINGANLRKETAPIAPEVAALIPTINLV